MRARELLAANHGGQAAERTGSLLGKTMIMNFARRSDHNSAGTRSAGLQGPGFVPGNQHNQNRDLPATTW